MEATRSPELLLQMLNGRQEFEPRNPFWADVVFERAESGLIATTAAVSRGSKAMCEVRQYPLSFAEGDKIKRWSRSMWRLRPKGRRANIPVEIEHPVGLALCTRQNELGGLKGFKLLSKADGEG